MGCLCKVRSVSNLELFGNLTSWAISSTKAGGIIGVLTALTAYYIGLADLLASQPNPIFNLPLGTWLGGSKKD